MKLPMNKKMIGSANGPYAALAGAMPSSTTSVGPSNAVAASGIASVIQKMIISTRIALSRCAASDSPGIGSSNIAFNNIATTGRVPVDPLWMDSLELSRGPNANIFGLGNASGTVNQVPATANLSRDFTKAELRVDSYGGWRGSLDVNRRVFKDKPAPTNLEVPPHHYAGDSHILIGEDAA